ncbi:MAG: pyrimidine-nucleoside phosphorylase, partial [Candidatus Thermoplasmatota archaeon]|nr:pyrimidine-nucleoside phosphorylase [Candidatus Thermoplasmatota archaeon]
SILPQSAKITEITALGAGYLSNINAMTLAEIARNHGAGRFTIDDSITPEIGFEILPNRGDYISEGDVW